MSEYAYLHTQPDSIKFSLKYSDNSGERIVVSLSDKKKDVSIKDSGDTILIPVEDIDWLRQVLDDIKSIVKMSEPKK